MTGLMNEYAGEKQNGKQCHGQLRVARQQQQHRLDLAMQKPLEQYQRHERTSKPKEA
ncbi:MAG: hypothetical protein JNM55_01200 [Anaerolineales bacterium]|nr:hypothetical protein [Anaerolineales bacterium]